MEPQQTSSSKSIIWIVILVILIGIGTYFVIGKANHNPAPGTESATFNNTSPIVNGIEAKDQLVGNSVIISNIALDKGGFVAIHLSDNGQPGAIIGTKYFDRGERPGTVELSAQTKDGQTYFAMLHSDNKGDKKYDPAKDLPLKDASGNIIMQSFKALNVLPDIKG